MENTKTKTYIWWKDEKMIGTILLIIISAFQIFAFLKVPFLSTIHGYTIGMLIGFYNPLFYLFMAYKASKMIFGEKVKLPKWVKLNDKTFLFLSISIIFIGTSLFFYQDKTGFTTIGLKPWNSFKDWFNDFTNSTAWAPKNTNGGILGAFLYSFFAMISSGIGAFIVSIVLLAFSLSIVLTGTFFGFYKNIKIKKTIDIKGKEIKSSEIINTDVLVFDEEEKPATDIKEKEIDLEFPFEDPFN